MKKTFKHILLACVALTTMVACSNVDYTGEYSEDGTYQSGNQVYFYFAEPADTVLNYSCLLYTSPSPRDGATSRMPSSA